MLSGDSGAANGWDRLGPTVSQAPGPPGAAGPRPPRAAPRTLGPGAVGAGGA